MSNQSERGFSCKIDFRSDNEIAASGDEEEAQTDLSNEPTCRENRLNNGGYIVT